MRGGASSTRLAGVVLFVLATAPPLGHADGEDAASIVRRTSVEVARARDLDVAVAAATAGVDALSRRGHVDDDHAAALYGVLATALAARDGRLYGGAAPAPAHVTARKVRPLDPGPGESGPLRPSWLVAGPALALYDRALLRSDGSMRPVGRGNGTAERAASLFAQVGDPVRAARTRIALAASWIEELRRLDNSIMVRDFPLLAAAHALGACGPDAESLPEWRELRRLLDEALDVLAARADRLRARAGGHASYAEVLGSLRLASARVRPHDEAGRRAALDDVGAVRDVAGAQLRALPDDSTFLSLVEDAAKVEVELCRDVGDGAGMRAALERLGARFATDAAWQQADGRAKLAEFPSLVTPWADVAVLEALAVAVADGDPAKAVAARLSAVRALPPTAFTQATVASVASDPTLPARVRFGARLDEARVAFGRARPDEGRAALEAARAVATGTPDLDADLPSLAWALECRRIGRTGEALDACMAILRVRPEHVMPTTWTGTRAAVTAAQLFAATANYDAAHAVVDRLVAALRKDAPLHRALAAPAGPAEGPTASAYAAAVDLSGLRDLCDQLGRADDAGYFAGPIGPPLARPFPTAFDRLAQGDVAAAVDAARTDRGVGSEAPVVPGDARMVLADVLLSAGESEEARAVVEEVDRAIRARASPEGASHELRVGVWAQTRLAELADVVRGGTVYRAWVVRREGPVRRVTIGPVEAVDEALQRLRDAVHEEASEETEAYRSAVAQARRVAWAPVADLLGADVSTVHLVLDGGYAAAPVERIPHREGGAALATVLRVARQPTVTSVLPAGGALGRGALLVGDVDFDLAFRPGRPALTGPSPSRLLARVPGLRPFTRLPATVAELTAIQAIFGARAGGVRTDTLVEDRASEAALRAAVAGRAFVHLATHGFVRAELAAPIALRDDLSAYLRPGIERFAFQVDPLAASGLALAGANARERADDDDGILTAREATELDLRGARLVVLSACDTARGVAVAGEGLVGLVQAFRAAGARSVVGSLWPVDDAVTAELMPRLYDALLERDRTVPEALAEATRRLAAERGGKAALPPRHLAAFVAFGTGR